MTLDVDVPLNPNIHTHASCGIDRRTAVTRSLMAFTSAERAHLMTAFKRETERIAQGPDHWGKEGGRAKLPSSESGIGAYGLHCVQGIIVQQLPLFSPV